jgi:hypothetical protein
MESKEERLTRGRKVPTFLNLLSTESELICLVGIVDVSLGGCSTVYQVLVSRM